MPPTATRELQTLTHIPTCAQLRRELGVYVLGAIGPADRGAIESHLASCAECRNQLADFAGLPALLRRVPVDDVAELAAGSGGDGGGTPPDPPLEALLSHAAKRRMHHTWSRLTAAAAAGLVAGATAAYAVFGIPPQRPGSLTLPGAITVRGSNPRYEATAVVTYAGRPWGVQLYVQVEGVAAGTRCVFDVTTVSGQESEAASWTVAADDKDAWYTASSSIPITSVRGFVVTAGSTTLVRVSVPVAPTRTGDPR